MKNIHINGQPHSFALDEAGNIEQVLALFFNGQKQSTFALALNGEFVGKADYANTSVNNGDSLDIMLPIQGG